MPNPFSSVQPALAAVGLWVGAASLVAFALAALDKSRARRGGPRMSERTLLLWALVGGTPGLVLAMVLVRHKTKKGAFLLPLALIVAVQLALVWWLLHPT